MKSGSVVPMKNQVRGNAEKIADAVKKAVKKTDRVCNERHQAVNEVNIWRNEANIWRLDTSGVLV